MWNAMQEYDSIPPCPRVFPETAKENPSRRHRGTENTEDFRFQIHLNSVSLRASVVEVVFTTVSRTMDPLGAGRQLRGGCFRRGTGDGRRGTLSSFYGTGSPPQVVNRVEGALSNRAEIFSSGKRLRYGTAQPISHAAISLGMS